MNDNLPVTSIDAQETLEVAARYADRGNVEQAKSHTEFAKVQALIVIAERLEALCEILANRPA